ncbi:MAG: DNA alkylation repair protein [Eubacteriales bacterium]|nr:DNA alkylation repair protein [Eubacteriales bacterium]
MYFPVLLYTYCDEGYRDFTAKLIPTVTYEHFVGVRNPEMKKITTRLKKDTGLCNEFLKLLPHYYYEENGFHAGILQNMKDYDECLKKVEEFLPYVDNWATSDGLLPKSFAKNKDKLMPSIDKWIEDDKTYTVRFAIDMLMSNYLDEAFDEEHLEKVIKVCPMGQSDTEKDYYIRMMAAWYMATALAKQWESTIKVIEDKRLSKWVHNKSIQKAIESYRVSDERKEYLRSLKIK